MHPLYGTTSVSLLFRTEFRKDVKERKNKKQKKEISHWQQQANREERAIELLESCRELLPSGAARGKSLVIGRLPFLMPGGAYYSMVKVS